MPIPTWSIQPVEALSISYGKNLANGDKPLFVDFFANENDFAAALHEGGITGVVKDENDQDENNDDDDSNMDEDPDKPPGIALEGTASRGTISGVPPTENPVDFLGAAPP